MSKQSEKVIQRTNAQAECDLGTHSYLTRGFSIEYNQKMTEINEIAMFRISCPILPYEEEKIQVFLKYEILCFSYQKVQGKDETILDYFPFYEGTFQMRRLASGLRDYFVILMGKSNFGVIECMVHSTILNYRFQLPTEKSSVARELFSDFLKNYTRGCKVLCL